MLYLPLKDFEGLTSSFVLVTFCLRYPVKGTLYLRRTYVYLLASSCDIVYLHMVMEKENMAYYSRVP